MCEILEREGIDRSVKTRGVYVMEAPDVPGLKIGALGLNSDEGRKLSTRISEISQGSRKLFQVVAFLDLRDESRAMVRAVEALAHLALDESRGKVKVNDKNLREQFEVDIEVAKWAIVKACETARSHVGKDDQNSSDSAF